MNFFPEGQEFTVFKNSDNSGWMGEIYKRTKDNKFIFHDGDVSYTAEELREIANKLDELNHNSNG